MAFNFYVEYEKRFPHLIKEQDGITMVNILNGDHYKWVPATPLLQELACYGSTAAGKHLANQEYSKIVCEYEIKKTFDERGKSNKPDITIFTPKGSIAGMIENGAMTTEHTAENLDNRLYEKLVQVVNVALMNNTMNQLISTIAMQSTIFDYELYLSNSKQFHTFVNLASSVSRFERFKITGIASVLFFISLEDLQQLKFKLDGVPLTVEAAKKMPIFNLNQPTSIIHLLYLNNGSVVPNTSPSVSKNSFKFVPNIKFVSALFLSRLLLRSLNPGGSYADNVRPIDWARVHNDVVEFANTQIHMSHKLGWKFHPDNASDITQEYAKVTSGDRTVNASAATNIVEFNRVTERIEGIEQFVDDEIFIISADMALNDAQHSNCTLLLIKMAMMEAKGDHIAIGTWLKKYKVNINGLNPAQLRMLSEQFLRITPAITFSGFINDAVMQELGRVKQNTIAQSPADAAKFFYRAQLKTLSTAAIMVGDKRLETIELITGAGFGDNKYHTHDTNVMQKEIADVANIYAPYLSMKNFNIIKKSHAFKSDIDILETRLALGEISFKTDPTTFWTYVHLLRKGLETNRHIAGMRAFYAHFSKSPFGEKVKDATITTLESMASDENQSIGAQHTLWTNCYTPSVAKADYKKYLFNLNNLFENNFKAHVVIDPKIIRMKAEELSNLNVEVDTNTLIPFIIMDIAGIEQRKIITASKSKKTEFNNDDKALPISAAAAVLGYKDYINGTNVLLSKTLAKEVKDTVIEINNYSDDYDWNSFGSVKSRTVESSIIHNIENYFSSLQKDTTNLFVDSLVEAAIA